MSKATTGSFKIAREECSERLSEYQKIIEENRDKKRSDYLTPSQGQAEALAIELIRDLIEASESDQKVIKPMMIAQLAKSLEADSQVYHRRFDLRWIDIPLVTPTYPPFIALVDDKLEYLVEDGSSLMVEDDYKALLKCLIAHETANRYRW